MLSHRTPVRDTSPQALAALQASSQELLAKLVKELDPQAHFVSYASQSFVAFRQGIYLELSLEYDSARVRRGIAIQTCRNGI